MEIAARTDTSAPVADDVEDASGDVRAAIIDELLTARAEVHAGEVKQVWMALQWAHAHPAPVDADGVVLDYAGWGDPSLLVPDVPGREVTPLVPIAGPGAPLVSPLAALELGAALGRSHDHARQLLGDALELAHRLPRLWALCQQGRVPVWLARQISRETHDLSLEAARWADKLICAVPDKVAAVDARRLIHEARLDADPDRAQADEEEAAARRGVWLRRDRRAPGVTDVNMTLDADDADRLDATLNRVAADLRDLGDSTSRDERRATAVGILADPQHALDLMSGRTDERASGLGGDVDLVVHLTEDDLTGEGGVGVEETRGAVSATQLAAWIRRRATAGGRVRVRAVLRGTAPAGPSIDAWLARHGLDVPVTTLRPIRLDDDMCVDHHDPPPRLALPTSGRRQLRLDQSHRPPLHRRPPQPRPAAPLNRRQHRPTRPPPGGRATGTPTPRSVTPRGPRVAPDLPDATRPAGRRGLGAPSVPLTPAHAKRHDVWSHLACLGCLRACRTWTDDAQDPDPESTKAPACRRGPSILVAGAGFEPATSGL